MILSEMNMERFTDGNAEILIAEFGESVEMMKQHLSNLRAYEDELIKLTNPKRQREFLLIRQMLNELRREECKLQYDETGKPFVANGEFRLSISHSKDHAALIVHDSREVGIDIETPSDRVLKVSKRFLNKDEQEFIGDDTTAMMIVWSAKEALYKIIGKEAVDFAEQLRINTFIAEKDGILKAIHLPTSKKFELKYRVKPEYILVYCINN